MIRITEVKILRFRSINELQLIFSADGNTVAICGQNNVGKTNILRAIDLFFHPENYDYKLDVPHFKQANEFGGGSVYTCISISFLDTSSNTTYCFTRDFKLFIQEKNSLIKCYSIKDNVKTELEEKATKTFLSKIKLYFIQSVDSILFDTINDIADEVLELKYKNARFSESRKLLKKYYDEYIDGMQEILNDFATQISGTFTDFNKNWSIEFVVPKNSNSFKELITKDVSFNLYDKGAKGIVNKGAGLQRLALILLQFEAIKRNKKTQSIVLIDEPDLYIHEGMQKQLKRFIDKMSTNTQVIYTTHSHIFIDTYKLDNTFLIELNCEKKSVKGKDEDFYFTEKVDLNADIGHQKICEHLGIQQDVAEPLEPKNILVEGESDKQYLLELSKFFQLPSINIISANGVTNFPKWLEFYNSFYKNLSGTKPFIKVVFDNDVAGRDTYKKVKPEKYSYITVEKVIINNCYGDANLMEDGNNTNNEIEDFVYPEVVCFLVNKLLAKRSMQPINVNKLISKAGKPSFKGSGILSLLENEKNDKNPERGQEVTFSISNLATENIKTSLANMFKLELNTKLISILNECKIKYPYVESALHELFDFSTN